MPSSADARLSDKEVFTLLSKAREQYDQYVSQLPDLTTVLTTDDPGVVPTYDATRQLGLVIQR